MNGAQPVRASDDLESFVLILIYYSIRYLQSNLEEPEEVAKFLDRVYDRYTLYKKRIIVGQYKSKMICKDGELIHDHPALPSGFLVTFDNPPLCDLINGLLSCFKSYYTEWQATLFASLLPGGRSTGGSTYREGSPCPPARKVAKLDSQTADLVDPKGPAPHDSQTDLDRVRPTHDMVIQLFQVAIDSDWVDESPFGDQVAMAKYHSPFEIAPIVLPGGLRPGEVLSEDV